MFDGYAAWDEREEASHEAANPPTGLAGLFALLLALTIVWLAAALFCPDAVSQLGADF